MKSWVLAMALAAAASLSPLLPAAAPPARLTYICSFKGSAPAFVEIQMQPDGQTSFQARLHDADPLATLQFTAAPALAAQMFADARAVDNFGGPQLESKAKVAYTGDKMLAYDDGARHQSQTFTYTTLRPAAALVTAFQRITTTGADALLLQRAMRYQPLDVLGLLDRIRSDWDNHVMGAPELLAPVLRQLIADPAMMDAARSRARALLHSMHLDAATP